MIIKRKKSAKKKVEPQEVQDENQPKVEEAVSDTNATVEEPVKEEPKKEEEYNLFDIDNIDFTQRSERRTGSRRRGYRRIDDRNLVSRAQEETEQIKQNAYQEGYNAGMQQAQADIENFRSMLGAFLGAEDKIFNEIAPNILNIAMDIAQKIIKTEIQQDPKIVLNNVLEILKTLSKSESKVSLRVNPIQVQYLKDTLPEQLKILGMETRLSVLSDENVGEGGCIIQTTNGMVNATIESQLEIVQMALRSIE